MSANALIVALSLLAIAVPHVLPLQRAAPVTAAVVWSIALVLRALIVVAVGIFVSARLAHADSIESVFGWCWHEILPAVSDRLGFAEHPVAHATVAIPLALVGASVAIHARGLRRAAVGLRRRLDAEATVGPDGSFVIADDAVVVAVTRLGRGRVVVSSRALVEMDDGELAAGLAHETAHIRRRHRPILVVASLLAKVGRLLPGTATAERELTFHLERDADAAAIRDLHDPLSLASAICKVAQCQAPAGVASLGGSGPVVQRVAELVDGGRTRSRAIEQVARALAVMLCALAVALTLTTSAWAFDGERQARQHFCTHRG
jgi:Zn-dependent protease with chaperone function